MACDVEGDCLASSRSAQFSRTLRVGNMRVYCVVLLLISPSLARRYRPSHSYPHSTGHSGTGSGGGSYYPPSTGLSGNSYGYNRRNYNQQYSPRNNYSPKTEVHHHYHYNPPHQVTYRSTQHPVYLGTPPVYIYEYRDSGSRFDNLLTGLALYNLGRLSANSHNYHNYDPHREYSGNSGEICKLGISKRTGEYEETRIDCKLMSSFIWEANVSPKENNRQDVVSSKTISRTVTNTTSNANGSDNTSVTTVTVTNVTVTDALNSKGPSIKVTSDMTCYMIRLSSYSNLKKNVECGLLQEYARSSMSRNGSESRKPIMATTLLNLILCLTFSLCYKCN